MNDELKELFSVTRKKRGQEYQARLEKIVLEHVDSVPNSSNPKLIFASGQPGSGKTALIQRIFQDYPDEKFVVVDIDNYRRYHPDYDKVKQYRKDFIILTNSFLFDLEEDILVNAFEKGKNVIYVGTLRDTDFICNFVIKNAKEQNYHIGVYVLVVPLIISLLSAVERYEEQLLNEADALHFIDASFHALANEGFERTLNCIERDSLADSFKFCKRGKIRDSLPELIDFKKGVVETLHKERNGILLNKEDILLRLNTLKNTLQKDCDKEADTLKTLFDLFELTFNQTKTHSGEDDGIESYSK